MRGDGQYARGFTLLLYGLGIFLFAVMSFETVSPRAWQGTNRKVLLPEPGQMSPYWSCLGALMLVVASIRSWGVPSAWSATLVLCVVMIFWFPIGSFRGDDVVPVPPRG